MAAIAFKKKSFRRYFEEEENYIWFHQVIARLVDAPTIEITRLIQGNIVAELHARDEHRAAVWFDTTWTGPHGSYTRATAGYVGTPFSAGLESEWKDMRRATVGTSGSTMRTPLRIFAPNLVQYVSAHSVLGCTDRPDGPGSHRTRSASAPEAGDAATIVTRTTPSLDSPCRLRRRRRLGTPLA